MSLFWILNKTSFLYISEFLLVFFFFLSHRRAPFFFSVHPHLYFDLQRYLNNDMGHSCNKLKFQSTFKVSPKKLQTLTKIPIDFHSAITKVKWTTLSGSSSSKYLLFPFVWELIPLQKSGMGNVECYAQGYVYCVRPLDNSSGMLLENAITFL